jgi:hypothetical protein
MKATKAIRRLVDDMTCLWWRTSGVANGHGSRIVTSPGSTASGEAGRGPGFAVNGGGVPVVFDPT